MNKCSAFADAKKSLKFSRIVSVLPGFRLLLLQPNPEYISGSDLQKLVRDAQREKRSDFSDYGDYLPCVSGGSLVYQLGYP